MQTPLPVISKLPMVGTSIFAKMSALAREHNAINLSQGFPDFNCDYSLLELVDKYMRKGMNQYAPMPGVIELREAIAVKTEKLYQQQYDPETEITVTAGATQAIFTAITALIRDGDEVVVFTPAYDCYEPAIVLAGGKPVHVELKYPDYHIDWKEVKKVISRKTRMIIINTPHNPTGALLSADDITQLIKVTDNTDIIILSDEVYEHIVFDKKIHESLAMHPKLAARSAIVSSFGKTYHTTGWKIGYCIAPKSLMAEIRKVHQFNVFSVNTPIQYAYAEFLGNEDLHLELNAFYQKKRNYFLKALEGSRFKINPAKGTYFQLLDYSNISKEKDTDFANELTVKHKLASIPVSVFYYNEVDNKVLRFCFAKSEETLEKAAGILHKL